MISFGTKIVVILIFTSISVTLQDDSYSKVSNDIINEELTVLPTHAFKDYPSSMGWETLIRIQSANLSTIEPEAFFNVRIHHIEIIYNEIEALKTKMFVNVSVRAFSLNNNKIKSIQSGTFDDIHAYDTDGTFKLYLYGNKLENITRGIFNNLNVNAIFLQKNLIRFIGKESFNYIPKLEHLDLSGNLLERIDVGVFQNIGSDIYISLKNNKITFVDAQAFENTTQLTLVLKGNQVHMRKGYFTNSPDIIKFVI